MRRLRRQHCAQVLRGCDADDRRSPERRAVVRQREARSCARPPRLHFIRRSAVARRSRRQHHLSRELVPARNQERCEGCGACSRDSREQIGEHTSELQSQSNLVCRLLLEKKKKKKKT